MNDMFDKEALAALKVEKEKRIKTELNKLNKQFKDLDDKSKKIVESLIKNAAFMIVTLSDLQQEINLNGIVSIYKNGENQFGTKKSPEVEIYNTMIKNHMSIMKQLTDLIPREQVQSQDDGFDTFVNRR
ncbi:hypothetical protein [Paenibacillus glycanilyticus]|uniref:hypothetical protein n=1 Tax=Paenibacillus glycanilyticus TaxID=126569 RepID=UPI0013E2BB74|nr:hypothetical protein [Paenibacillus glycanilyticus]